MTVRGLHDDDLDNDTATISHAVTGYGTVTSAVRCFGDGDG